MTAWSELLDQLGGMPQELERVLRLVPEERLRWTPESWGGAPGETFSAIGHSSSLTSSGTATTSHPRLLDEHDSSSRR